MTKQNEVEPNPLFEYLRLRKESDPNYDQERDAKHAREHMFGEIVCGFILVLPIIICFF